MPAVLPRRARTLSRWGRNRPQTPARWRALSDPALLVAVALVAGCGKEGPAPSASSSAPPPTSALAPPSSYGAPLGAPISAEKVVSAINPKREQPYSGPRGRLKGTVRIEGDPPPDTGLKFPERCKDSVVAYGKLFRVGLDKALADAMVAVTNYGDRGYVPAEGEAVKVALHRCAPAKLTYTVTYGQRIDAFNIDQVASYMPFLDGASTRTVMVAVPQGAAVKLYPMGPSPAHYMLRDQLDSGLSAHVFLLNYATHDVTGLDGQYEIKNIPVGPVHVGVLLPVLGKSEERDLDIKEGDNTLDFTLRFDAAKDLPKRTAPAASGSASAGPAAPSATAKGQTGARPR